MADLKVCFKLRKNTTETCKMFKVALAEQKIERTHFLEVFQVHLVCFFKFINHVPSTEYAECLGCASTKVTYMWIK